MDVEVVVEVAVALEAGVVGAKPALAAAVVEVAGAMEVGEVKPAVVEAEVGVL